LLTQKKGSKEKGTPIKPLFPHSNKIFLTKSKPILATLRSGVTFLKILSPFGRFGRGNSVGANLKCGGNSLNLLEVRKYKENFLAPATAWLCYLTTYGS
ncbi:hypothetical protein ACLSY1_09880, partial [Avibacterium avium]